MSGGQYYSDGLKMLSSFHERILKKDKNETLELERFFELPLSASIFYKGIIDRLSINSDGLIRITDYKTGKTIPDPDIDIQLRSYALWVFDIFDVNKIELVYEALRYKKRIRSVVYSDVINDTREELITETKKFFQATSFQAHPNILCEWCGYNPICTDAKNSNSKGNWSGILKILSFSKNGNKCPSCGSKLKKRNGRYGPFLGCSDFPTCRYTRDI